MGAPVPEFDPVADNSAETLLGALRTIAAPERRKHASVYNYWLSIRGNKQFPPIRDLDPLEISDAGPFSLLLEMIGGGEDAEIRHIGQAIKGNVEAEKVGDAPNPSLLSCIATRLPVVAGCREPFAFEDEFEVDGARTRCWVTLLPFSATGTWIDYVYGFVSLDPAVGGVPEMPPVSEAAAEIAEPTPAEAAEALVELADPVDDAPLTEDFADAGRASEVSLPGFPAAPHVQPENEEPALAKPTFSAKFFETLANVGGFYGRTAEIELDLDSAVLETGEHAGDEPAPEPHSILEGTLHNKLSEVRAKADEARAAKLRANMALYEGLGAAYDFALDAEESPEEYLRLVEAEGLKIQLRSPMKPVAKLAFDGMCDDCTIQQLEAILTWAFDEELPRGSLAARIEEAGGIGPILSGQVRVAA